MTESSGSQPGESAPRGAPRRAAAPVAAQGPAWDPFERVYGPGGTIDRDYASKRLPVLVDLLRRHPACFATRIDVGRLGEMLSRPDSQEMRDAADQEAFEGALRKFSEAHLHELADQAMQQGLAEALMGIARDEAVTRRDRAAAALGVALLSVPPDAKGLRGRGIMDLVLRVTMEEQTAQEGLRKKARETEGGLGPDDLTTFWQTYPALRWQHEERYRREVTHVLKAIEHDEMPAAISVDLGMRGAAKLLAEVAAAKAEGRLVEAREAESILKVPFVQDMMEDGRTVVCARWRAEMANTDDVRSDERRALLRSLEMGTRLVEEHGPGSDAILFYLYMRAVVQGHYHVRDEAELDAAKSLFAPAGLAADGAVTYAAHLAARGDFDSQHRVLVAGLEIWPDHAGVRAAAEAMGLAEEERARAVRHGPTYEEDEKAEARAAAKAAKQEDEEE